MLLTNSVLRIEKTYNNSLFNNRICSNFCRTATTNLSQENRENHVSMHLESGPSSIATKSYICYFSMGLHISLLDHVYMVRNILTDEQTILALKNYHRSIGLHIVGLHTCNAYLCTCLHSRPDLHYM